MDARVQRYVMSCKALLAQQRSAVSRHLPLHQRKLLGVTGPPGATGPQGMMGAVGAGPFGPAGQQGASNAPSDQRYRSFVERYVIARACFFRVGSEKEDAWQATQDADAIYKKIGRTSRRYNDETETEII